MISRLDIEERAREWGLREDVVEKDYVLGWLLWGIGADPELATGWAFKGGTCLKKCFLETYRFSEDLDFTVLPGGPASIDQIRPLLARVIERVGNESGINFSQQVPTLRALPSGHQTEGRVYYVGPRMTPTPASVKLDITATEVVARPTTHRPISHSFPDSLPAPATVHCYSFEEVFAEKIRALGERGRPRDLYDVVNLFRRTDSRGDAAVIRAILVEKCRTKGVRIPTAETVANESAFAEIEAAWESMLGHQLLTLPPLQDFWDELHRVFDWLNGERPPTSIESMAAPTREPINSDWQPPATISTWGERVPLEAVRFAAANNLCIELGYNGSSRLVEPYSLRRTQAGNLVLYAVKVETGESRSYRVDRIERVEVTTKSFRPRFLVEFTSGGPIRALPIERRPRVGSLMRTQSRARVVQFEVTCPYCSRRFRRATNNRLLGIHNDESGRRCFGSGRHGFLS